MPKNKGETRNEYRYLVGDMKALTHEELTKLLDSITDAEFRAMCLVGYFHAMRVSEICGLKRNDVSENTITIRRLKHSYTNTQPLNEIEMQALADVPSHGEFMFKIRSRKTFGRWFKKACLKVGIAPDKAHSHTLKHSCGFHLAEANTTLPIIQAHMGHRSASSTFIYAKPSDDTVARVVKAALQIKGDVK